MSNIAIIITNPNHHFEMTFEVALRLHSLGHQPFYCSLCELRRMSTPVERMEQLGLKYYRQDKISKNLKPSSGAKSLGSNRSLLRNILRQLFWYVKIRSFVSNVLSKADQVLLMNDTAFPGNLICSWLKKRKIPFHLLQEGIRFPLPGEGKSNYGAGGANKILVWGKRSGQYFNSVKADISSVEITGSPRFDRFVEEIKTIKNEDKKSEKVLGLFTNPIDDQGFCTKSEKLALFESFVQRAAPFLQEKQVLLGVKCHPREDVSEYLTIAEKYTKAFELDKNIKNAIVNVDAGIIMASTVGLELLAADRNIGQLEIPGFGYVFDYLESKSIVKIPLDLEFDLSRLFSARADSTYFQEHIELKNSVERITKALIS